MHRLSPFYLVAIITLVHVLEVYGQSLGRTAYGQFGMGDVVQIGTARQMALSGTATAITPGKINMLHPALNSFHKGLVSFDGGLSGLRMWAYAVDNRQIMYGGNISYLGVMVPISKKYYTLAFGINPYSNANSRFTSFRNFENSDFRALDRIETKGGLNRIFWDHAFFIHKNLRVGLGTSFIFGNIRRIYNTTIIYPLHNSNAILNFDQTYRLYELKPSVAYLLPLGNERSITAAFSYGLGGNAASKVLVVNSQNRYNPTANVYDVKYMDTVTAAVQNEPTSLRLPHVFRGGLTLEKTNRHSLGVEIVHTDYSQYKGFEFQNPYRNSVRLQVGGEYIPKYNAFRQYWKRMVYRAGGVWEQTAFTDANGNQVVSLGLSGGFGLPLGRQIPNMLDLSFELGRRGARQPGSVEETYLRFHIGISIQERWFQRYKLD